MSAPGPASAAELERQVVALKNAGIRPVYSTEEAEREAREQSAIIQLEADAIREAGKG